MKLSTQGRRTHVPEDGRNTRETQARSRVKANARAFCNRSFLNRQPVCILLVFLLLIFLAAPLTGVTARPSQQGGTTRYTYDDKGRLKTVTLPNGQVATYNYDAAGNITSITRRTQTTITGFSPTEGPVGTEVTITGFGFLPTLSANVVTLNDVEVEVLSATANELVVEIPLGATSGQITVSNAANGQATTADQFIVLEDNPPSIDEFFPGIGVVGDPVTIIGMNFSAIPTDNVVKFNGVTATVTSATETTIVANVPAGATSGQISVSTAKGTGFSLRNFEVTDAEFISTMNIGETKTVTITTPGRTGLLYFNGTAGQNINVILTEVNFTPPNRTEIELFDPRGSHIGRLGAGEIFDTVLRRVRLPLTGRYTLFIDPRNSTGTMKITVNNIVDPTGTIQIDGPPVTLNFTMVGQQGLLTFSATSGQRVILIRSGTSAFTNIGYQLFDPNGEFVNPVDAGADLWRYGALPLTGTYTLEVFPGSFEGVVVGSITISLATQPAPATGSIVVDGPAVQFTTTTPGQDISVTFNGTAGQVLTLQVSPMTIPSSLLFVRNPDGSILGFGRTITSPGFSSDLPALPETATYTVSLVPHNTGTGNATLRVFVPQPTPITPGGPPLTLNFTVPNQHHNLTFAGVPGQRVSIQTSAVTIGRHSIQILRPDGTLLGSNFVNGSFAVFIDPRTLPVAGTYTLAIVPQDFRSLGTITVRLFDVPPDPSAALTINGPPVTLTATVPGQNINFTFSGTTGQQITLRFTGISIPSCMTLTGTNPGGSLFLSTVNCGDPLTSSLALQETGTFRLLIDPLGANIGSITVAITSP